MRYSPANLRRCIDDVLSEVRKAQASATPHPFLPVIAQSLEEMKKNVRAKQADRESMSVGLGRIVTDDYAFSESKLGDQILKVVNEFGGMSEED